MGKVSVILDEEREEKLRDIAIEKFGRKRGYLTKALEESVRMWIEENEKDYLEEK